MKFAHINIRSLFPKLEVFKETVLTENFDVVAVTETWLNDNITNNMLSIPGYIFLRNDRLARGGGVGIYLKHHLKYTQIQTNNEIEQLWIQIVYNNNKICIGSIYRSPSMSYNDFIDVFESSVAELLPECDQIICMGDFNIDLLSPEKNITKHFTDFLESVGLHQIIDQPTRVTVNSSSLLDLILVLHKDIISKCGILPTHAISDHDLVYCFMGQGTKQIYNKRTFREFKNLNIEALQGDLNAIPWDIIYNLQKIDEKMNFLHNALLQLQNKHVPLVTRTFKNTFKPWITDNAKLLQKLRDKAHARFRKTKKTTDYEYYKQLRNHTNLVIKLEQKAYFQQSVQCNTDFWKTAKKLNILNKRHSEIPDTLKNVNEINNHFINSIPKSVNYDNKELLQFFKERTHQKFEFSQVDEMNVLKHLCSIKSNACGSDGLHIKFIIACCPYILPYITHVINHCLSKGVFPSMWKTALVLPMPKISNPESYKDLRPISLLPSLSKVLEKEVNSQIRTYLEKEKLLPSTQFGFRKNHSCCSALAHVTDDIFKARDQKKLTFLILLDYSKAFDTLDHSLLLSILQYIGMSKYVIEFFKNYLIHRLQKVSIDDQLSVQLEVLKGVPQGSILGPLLYIIYTSQLDKCLQHCKRAYYADDSQLYISCLPKDIALTVSKINSDLKSLHEMSAKYSLALNPTKSFYMIFAPKNQNHVIDSIEIKICNTTLQKREVLRNLGLMLDCELRFKKHISNCTSIAYAKLKNMYKFRHVLTQKQKIFLCDSIVLSNFNYCDVVYGPCLDVNDKNKIQKVQNSCLRFVYGIRSHNHISHKLKDAKWLNMEARREFHASCFYLDLIQSQCPEPLYNKISFRYQNHEVNLRTKHELEIPKHNTVTFERSFSYNIVKTMNKLFKSIKDIKKSTIRNYFNKLYNLSSI